MSITERAIDYFIITQRYEVMKRENVLIEDKVKEVSCEIKAKIEKL